jgi:dTDP-glucose 4,6-dehydratase
MTLLVTGGAGFIGRNFVELLRRERPDHELVVLDLLTYAGSREAVADFEADPAVHFVQGDVADGALLDELFQRHAPEGVVHFAAESHVDRSISSPSVFLQTNVLGTQVLLEAVRRHGNARVVMVSTDEVYGSLGDDDPPFTEQSPIQPRSPYSASKAAADHLCQAWVHTYGLDVVTTRCSNNYGPWQFPEKLIPVMIHRALDHAPLPVYGTGLNVRDWIHVNDHCKGVLAALEQGRSGAVYNFGADCERTNLAIVHLILDILQRPPALIEHVEDRAGHDWRYAIDARLAREELGWRPSRVLDDALAETVEWYVEHQAWWRPLVERPEQS